MTCVLTLIGLRVVAIGSSEVLLSGLVDTSHLSVKYQSVPWHGTEVRSRPHDITDSYLLKMTLEPWSRDGGVGVRCLLACLWPGQAS